jgi:hypothetical protein
MEQHFAPPHGLELRKGVFMGAGLADLQTIVRGDLIRTNHQSVFAAWQSGRDRTRFGLGKPESGGFGHFARQGCLVERWHDDVEWDAQAFEQLAAVA